MTKTTPIPSPLAALDAETQWVNSEPLTAAALRGKVVAVQFGTYSCINWIRTLPYVRAWVDAYRDRGLVVVGAQTPEFGFEQEIGGVRRALAAMGVEYPVVLDNAYAIWSAFENRYWPALYVLDGEGSVRYHHFGEGAYEESETIIRGLLGVDGDRVQREESGVELAADWNSLRSPETYVGSARGERRARDGAGGLGLNQWALSGRWAVDDESAVLEAEGGSITYRFGARDLNLVLTPPASGAAVRFEVRLDGRPPARRTAATSTSGGPARWTSHGSTSSSASPTPASTAPSRSASSTRASGPTSSPSARRRSPCRTRDPTGARCRAGCDARPVINHWRADPDASRHRPRRRVPRLRAARPHEHAPQAQRDPGRRPADPDARARALLPEGAPAAPRARRELSEDRRRPTPRSPRSPPTSTTRRRSSAPRSARSGRSWRTRGGSCRRTSTSRSTPTPTTTR